jgi:hypothetical protein
MEANHECSRTTDRVDQTGEELHKRDQKDAD